MPLDSTLTKTSLLAGDGLNTSFSYGFIIDDETDIEIILVTNATRVEVVQTLTTHYTITGVGSTSGGKFIMVSAPTSSQSVIARRKPTFSQGTNLVSQGPYSADNHEDIVNKLTQMGQYVDEILSRSVTVSLGGTLGFGLELPEPSADKLLGWNSGGTAIINIVNAGGALPLTHNDNILVRTDGVNTGNYQVTGITIDDSNNITGVVALTATGIITGATGSIFGNITLADGSITDSGGAIAFGNENLSTTGTFASGNMAVTGTLSTSGKATMESAQVTNALAVSTFSTLGLATLNSASVTNTLTVGASSTLFSASITNNLDAATIGSGTPGTGAFTTLSTSGLATLNSAQVTTALATDLFSTTGVATLNSAVVTNDLTVTSGDLEVTAGGLTVLTGTLSTNSMRVVSTTDANRCAEFSKNVETGLRAVVKILQDHTGGAQPCLGLDQDDTSEGFIDFVGTDTGVVTSGNSAASCRVELNGTKYLIALYTNA